MQLTQAKRRRGDLLTAAAVAALLAVMSVLLYTGSLTRQVTNMLVPTAVYIVMAVSLNLVVGLLGELSLGHAGFMSVGLFSGCLVSIALANTALPLAVRLPVSMLAGGLMAAVFGLLVGLPALRLRGDYLAIVTLACGEIIKNVITNLNFTGGALGLNTTAIYAGAKELLPYGAVLVLLTVAVMLNLKRSKYGRAIMAIRDNRIAAESVGLNVTWYKLAVFVICGVFRRVRRRAVWPLAGQHQGGCLRLQHVHRDTGHRGAGRYGQRARLHRVGHRADGAAGGAARGGGLPDAGVCHRADPGDAGHQQPHA